MNKQEITIDEAIKRLNECRYTSNFQPYVYVNKALDMAIEALEKQMQKKPLDKTEVKDGEEAIGEIGKCPCCEGTVDWSMDLCYCGQKLDWTDDEEVTEPAKPIAKMTQEDRERFFRGE